MLRSILKSISIGKVIRQIRNVHARASALCGCLRNKRWWPRASEFVMIIRHDAQGHHQQQQQRMTRYFSASCIVYISVRAFFPPIFFFISSPSHPHLHPLGILRLGSPPERYYWDYSMHMASKCDFFFFRLGFLKLHFTKHGTAGKQRRDSGRDGVDSKMPPTVPAVFLLRALLWDEKVIGRILFFHLTKNNHTLKLCTLLNLKNVWTRELSGRISLTFHSQKWSRSVCESESLRSFLPFPACSRPASEQVINIIHPSDVLTHEGCADPPTRGSGRSKESRAIAISMEQMVTAHREVWITNLAFYN